MKTLLKLLVIAIIAVFNRSSQLNKMQTLLYSTSYFVVSITLTNRELLISIPFDWPFRVPWCILIWFKWWMLNISFKKRLYFRLWIQRFLIIMCKCFFFPPVWYYFPYSTILNEYEWIWFLVLLGLYHFHEKVGRLSA